MILSPKRGNIQCHLNCGDGMPSSHTNSITPHGKPSNECQLYVGVCNPLYSEKKRIFRKVGSTAVV